MKYSWKNCAEKFDKCKNDVKILANPNINDQSLKYNTFMEALVDNIDLLTVNNYLRVLGSSPYDIENVFQFTNLFREIFNEEKYIIAYDIFGGMFSAEGTIKYFAPDTLEWEDLNINYEQFIEWAANGNIAEFYSAFLWDGCEAVISEMSSESGVLVYPFLWSEECQIETAQKKLVPIKEIMELNYKNKMMLDEI